MDLYGWSVVSFTTTGLRCRDGFAFCTLPKDKLCHWRAFITQLQNMALQHPLSADLSSERDRKKRSVLCRGLCFLTAGLLSSDSMHPACCWIPLPGDVHGISNSTCIEPNTTFPSPCQADILISLNGVILPDH